MFVNFFPVKRIFLEINPGFIAGPQSRVPGVPIWDADAKHSQASIGASVWVPPLEIQSSKLKIHSAKN